MADRKLSPTEFAQIRAEKGVGPAQFDQYFTRVGADIYLKDTSSTAAPDELGALRGEIAGKQTELSKFSGSKYVNFLGDVFNSSYLQNQDIIKQREVLRGALFGDRGFKPASYEALDPGQQEAIRNANKPGITAAIAALNETEASRGTRTEQILSEAESARANAQKALEDELTMLINRRDQLEQTQQQMISENRSFGLDALTKYPSLRDLLEPKDISDINKGILSDIVIGKIAQAAKIDSQRSAGGGGTSTERALAQDRQYYLSRINFMNPDDVDVFMRSFPEDYREWFVANIAIPYYQAGEGPEGQFTLKDISREYERSPFAQGDQTDSIQAAATELQGYINAGTTEFAAVMQDPSIPDSVKAKLKAPD